MRETRWSRAGKAACKRRRAVDSRAHAASAKMVRARVGCPGRVPGWHQSTMFGISLQPAGLTNSPWMVTWAGNMATSYASIYHGMRERKRISRRHTERDIKVDSTLFVLRDELTIIIDRAHFRNTGPISRFTLDDPSVMGKLADKLVGKKIAVVGGSTG